MIGRISGVCLIGLLFATVVLFPSSPNLILAHNFSSDESASFLSLVDQIKSAISPIRDDISSNITLARTQAQYAKMLLTGNVLKELKERNQRIATELSQMLDSLQGLTQQNTSTLGTINDVIAEAVTVRIDKNQLNNSTVQGLTLANDVNKILDEYSKAFSTQSNDMGIMNNTTAMKMDEKSPAKEDMKVDGRKSLADLGAYQRAVALTDIVIKRFNNQMKGNSTSTEIEQLVKVLEQLKIALQNKMPPASIMEIVHGQIHPNLQIAFNLELVSSPLREQTICPYLT
jgi:hypothetical protein